MQRGAQGNRSRGSSGQCDVVDETCAEQPPSRGRLPKAFVRHRSSIAGACEERRGIDRETDTSSKDRTSDHHGRAVLSLAPRERGEGVGECGVDGFPAGLTQASRPLTRRNTLQSHFSQGSLWIACKAPRHPLPAHAGRGVRCYWLLTFPNVASRSMRSSVHFTLRPGGSHRHFPPATIRSSVARSGANATATDGVAPSFTSSGSGW